MAAAGGGGSGNSNTPPRVGFVGLGAMGLAMATNLHADLMAQRSAAGADAPAAAAAVVPPLMVHNRTRDKATPLMEAGAIWADSPADMAASCDIVFSMLANDAALEAVFSTYLAAGPVAGSIWADCSTVLPSTTAALASLAASAGVNYLSCPVFGRPDAARARRLVVVMAGDAAAAARVRPLLQPLSRAFLDAGDVPARGHALKLAGNFHIVAALEMMAEGMTLADRAGIPRQALVDFYTYMLPGPIFAGYGGRMAADDFERTEANPGFALELGIKDVSHMQTLAESLGMRLPMADVVMGRLQQAAAAGRGQLDWSAIATVVREEAAAPAAEP